MKKLVFLAMALAAVMTACKGNQNQANSEMLEEDSIFQINDSTVGDIQTTVYAGTMPNGNTQVDYQLTLNTLSENANGTYTLTTTTLGDGIPQEAYTDSGQVVTIVGVPNDSTAIIYQLVSSTGAPTTNFKAEGDSAVTLVDNKFQKDKTSSTNKTLVKQTQKTK